MERESEKQSDKSSSGDDIKKVNAANEEKKIPCLDGKSSDKEPVSTKASNSEQNKEVNQAVEVNGCENSSKPEKKAVNNPPEAANEDTNEELDVNSPDQSESCSSVSASKSDNKNSSENSVNDKCVLNDEKMDVDSEIVDESDKTESKKCDSKLKNESESKSPESKTNNATKKFRGSVANDELMEVDESPKPSRKARKGKAKCDVSLSESTSHKEKSDSCSQKTKLDELKKEAESSQNGDVKKETKDPDEHESIAEQDNSKLNHKEKSSEKGIKSKKSTEKTSENSEEDKKPSESDESKEKSKSNSSTESKATMNSTESKPIKTEGSEKKKSKKGKPCEECKAVKSVKFQVVFQGKPRYLCSEVCCKSFKSKQKDGKPAAPPPPPPPPEQKPIVEPDTCGYCKKEIKEKKGYYPTVGEVKPLCSEECLLNYQESNVPKKKCSQCKVEIEDDLSCLSWETMEFCNEDCLGKYQSFLGSHCTCCQSPVQQTSLGKYCVCFGADIRQFCSGTCLEEFKKGLKVCSFCQKDLSTGSEGFLAPVGDKGMFKDFCTQQCMEKYEIMNTNLGPPQTQNCSYCSKSGIFKIQTKHGDKPAVLCSENCVAGYRYVNKISQKICENCYKFFDPEGDSEFLLQFEGVNKFYCSKPCMTLFVLSHRKIVPCTWCKVKKYNFDMIEKLDSSNHTQTYCSLNCISLYRVSVNATSAKSIRCDNCSKNLPAQYHLTMSDGSIRNFCNYQCVLHFQNQFTNVPTLTTSTPSNRQNPSSLPTTVAKTTGSSTTPVISNVMSLAAASPRSPAPNLTAKLVPQKLIAATPRQASPSVAIISTKATSPLTTATTPTSTVSTGSGVSQIVKEVIVKPPPPKSMKNKSVLCKPIMQTKGVSCKPHPCHKAVQTDESTLPTIVPIPVPIYVPTPVHMFSRPVPCPMPFPIPIPVPIFIPTTKDSPTQIMKHLKDIQDKIPSNPFEAELLMMAEMVAENDEKKGQSSESSAPSEKVDDSSSIPVLDSMALNEAVLDVEAALPPGIAPVVPKEQEEAPDPVDEYFLKDGRAHGQGKRSASGRGRGRGKRARTEGPPPDDLDPFASMPLLEDQNSAHHLEPADSSARLKHTFGVNAWKHWVLQKNTQLEKGSQSSRKFKLFKTDLLQLPPDELNYSLCLFVKEVRKPSGEEYAPASIYYLCLGVQQYLFENGRIDNIFTDPYYEKFTECLNEVLQNQEEIMTSEGYFISRIEEEVLWESKQLGAHSPHVLLNTLMYFNTKYFNLRSIDDHTHLSFSHITKHWRKTSVKAGPRSVILRYYPPSNKDWQNRRRKEEPTMYEQNENVENPLRCPVKLYEFYLSKCPESVKTRNDVFYLYPERSCVPDSPVWYSTQALGRDVISKMLQRIKTVREIYET